jgi:TonB family protein
MSAAVRALLDVLFATLWQDAIVGLFVALVVLVAGRRLNAATRHALFQAALLAMLAVPLATTLPHVASAAATIRGHATGPVGSGILTGESGGAPTSHRIDVVLSDTAVVSLAALWLAGAIVFLLRIAAGMLQLARLIRVSERVGDRNGVPVYASTRIRVPVAFGLMKPAIALPSAIVREGGKEFQCVLLHELAHIQRRDAWSHTFERLVHALLFFNPSVMLLLQSLALEREAACDDWAVAHSPDAASYTRSLAVLAVRTSFNAGMPATCGAIGFGHGIVRRIERLEDRRRNGSLLLSPLAIGGITFMLVSIALSLQVLAPAVAFSPQPKIMKAAAASSSCTRDVEVTYPAPPPGNAPAGRASVMVSVSAAGAVTATKIRQSSGNAAFDRIAVKLAKESGYQPALRNCKPVGGTFLYMFSSTGVQ